MEEFREEIINEAVEAGICEQGLEHLRNCKSIEEMLDYYVANPDWCLERKFPSMLILEKHKDLLEEKGVYIGCRFKRTDMFSKRQAYIFIGCKGNINVAMDYENEIIPMLYFAGGCRMKVICPQDNKRWRIRVPIYEFGLNDIQAKSNRNAEYIRFKNQML